VSNAIPTDHRLVDALKRDIYGGSLRPGSPLREEALADRFRVGRYTVRTALMQLAADGLVERTPNVGARVRRLSRAEVEDIYDVRRTIDLAAVDRIVGRRLALDDVRRAAERIERLERSTDLARRSVRRRTLDADLAFHRSVVEAAQSPRLLRAYATILGEVRLALTQLAGIAAVVPGEHGELLAMLEQSERAHARRWVIAHLDQGVRDIVRGLERQSP
jgi:DNA-binding GntR family transcriptional regulator